MADQPPATVSSEHPRPVHSFKPSSGTVTGTLGIAAAVVVVATCAVTERSLVGLQVGLVAALAGLLVWMVLLRPRVWAYTDQLRLRNMVSDTWLPLVKVEAVLVRATLNVWVDDRRYTCAGIGRTTRTMVREAKMGGPVSPGKDYAGAVESAIEDLAHAARRDLRGDPPPVRRQWAWPELAALTVLLLALIAAFAL